MSLWPELRHRIYELPCCPENEGDGGIYRSHAIFLGVDNMIDDGQTLRMREKGYERTIWAQQPAITKLNHRIRSEALPVYLKNHFVMQISRDYTLDKKFLDRMLERARLCPSRHGRPHFFLNGPLEWLQRMGRDNIEMIKNLDVLFALLPGSSYFRLFRGRPEMSEEVMVQ